MSSAVREAVSRKKERERELSLEILSLVVDVKWRSLELLRNVIGRDQVWVAKNMCERKPKGEENVKVRTEINGRCGELNPMR